MPEPTQNNNFSVRVLGDDEWSRLEPLWISLYQHQREHGMLVDLPAQAFQLWVASLQPLLGRFGFVYAAEDGASMVGFVSGRIRSLPSYFGGEMVGFIGEVFVVDSHRHQGIAGELLSKAQAWFREREIKRVELQVMTKNSQARDFYFRHGWVEELVQMVWLDRNGNEQATGIKLEANPPQFKK